MIKMVVMDVDGTLTDGKIYTTSNGEYMKAFDVKDGYGIRKLLDKGIVPVIITGRQSEIVKKRCDELGINEVYQGVENKLEKLEELMSEYSVQKFEVAYIGDDENDLECMREVGIVGCPNDAIGLVRRSANHISSFNGGNGAVREIIDWILGEC